MAFRNKVKTEGSLKASMHGRRGHEQHGGNHGSDVKKTDSLENMMLQGGNRKHASQAISTIGSLLDQDTANKPVADVQLGLARLMDQ